MKILSLLLFLVITSIYSFGQVSDTGDKVGIGDNTPSYKLDVNAGNNSTHARFIGTHTGIQGIQVEREGGAHIRLVTNYTSYGGGLESSSSLRFAVNGAGVQDPSMFINNYGKIGIGTTDPLQKLSVVDGQIFLGNTSVNQFESGRLRFGEYTNSFQGAFIHYDGSINVLNLGVHHTNDTDPASDYNSISIKRDNGNVGIGTTSPDSKLTVAGKIHAREIKVTTTAGADFVFEADYPLRSLKETERFIKENKHLPDIPSAEDMVEEGITLGEMNVKLLQKIEELTLYVIELEKKSDRALKENTELKQVIFKLKK